MSSPPPAFGVMPFLVGLGLTSLCLVATGCRFWPSVFLAGLIVPTGVRTCRKLELRRSAGLPLLSMASLGVLLDSFARTLLLGGWLMFVSFTTAVIKSYAESIFLIPIILIGLTMWLIYLLDQRPAGHGARRGSIWAGWGQAFRIRFTTRGLFVGIAFVALLLWPIHLWRMRPTYIEIANHQAFLAGLCLGEFQIMADRAEECRRRAVEGSAWEADDEVSQGLKACPFPDDIPAHNWREQAAIWDRAAERCLAASRRHQWISERYDVRIESGLNWLR